MLVNCKILRFVLVVHVFEDNSGWDDLQNFIFSRYERISKIYTLDLDGSAVPIIQDVRDEILYNEHVYPTCTVFSTLK